MSDKSYTKRRAAGDRGAAAAYRGCEFMIAALDPDQMPPDQGYEVAVAGRSNAGKSTALNALTGQRSLARTSKTPGRTRELIFFRIDDERRLVDLPGYGYAQVSKAVQSRWRRSLERYLEQRRCLRGVVLLMDIRHPLKDTDVQLLSWCVAANLPFHVLLSKADKLGRNQAAATLARVRRDLEGRGWSGSLQVFSAKTGDGVPELAGLLNEWLALAG